MTCSNCDSEHPNHVVAIKAKRFTREVAVVLCLDCIRKLLGPKAETFIRALLMEKR